MQTRNNNMDVADILNFAAGLLDTYGWTQGASYDRVTRRLDILGAIALASGCRKSFLVEPEFPLLRAPGARRANALAAWDALEATLDTDPVRWNDEQGRTVVEVTQLLRNVAARHTAAQ